MSKTFIIVLAFLLVFGIMPAAQITVSKPKASYPYLLYLPKEYSANDKNFPLVIYLGGGSQNGNDLNKLKTYGIPFYIEQGHEYNFIIASPQCPEKKYWTTENWFDSLYADLASTYRIDTTRIYVTGISNGGFGTWQVAMDYPHRFAAIAPLCGGVNDKDTVNLGSLKQLPIWTFHGTADDMIPIHETERIVNKLEAYGHIKFTRLQNEGHGIQYLYENNEIFDWLLQHSKKNNLDIPELFLPVKNERQIDSLLTASALKPFNGVVLIARNGKIIYSKTCGYSDLEKKIPLRFDNQFVVGSISKQMTAVIVLQEYEKGRLEINRPIHEYLPELSQSWADTVTVHHLLTHTHGIVELDRPTAFTAGSAFNYGYSSLGYDLLAKIVEKTSGKSFIRLSNELFVTCGMKNTLYPEKHTYPNLVKGYTEQRNSKLILDKESFRYSVASGAFISTAEGLMLWNDNLHSGKLLNQKTYELMISKQPGASRNHPIFGETFYGYGITVDTTDNQLQVGQTGLVPGFASMDFYFPKTKTSVIVLENILYDEDDLKKAFSYHTQILNLIREDKPSIN